MNKSLSLVINAVLCVAVIVLFILHFSGRKAAEPAAQQTFEAGEQALPIAYVNVDSLLLHYNFAVEANDRLTSKQEDARLQLNSRMRTLQTEQANFQQKLDNNAFLSRERAEQEYNRLLKKQQDLQALEAKLTDDLMEEQQKLSLQLRDSLNGYLEAFNAEAGYQVILSNQGNDNVLLAAPRYDITEQVVDGLNARLK